MKQKEGLQNSPPPGGGVELSSPKELMNTGLEARPENLDPSERSPLASSEKEHRLFFSVSLKNTEGAGMKTKTMTATTITF